METTITNPIIKLTAASIFQQDHLVMANVDLSIKAGELVYLVGKVGSGKTSLIRTLNAEIPLKVGEGYVADFALHNLKRKQIPYLRRKLGIVFQDFKLLIDRNVYENLAFVLRSTGWKSKNLIDKRIEEVLLKVGLEYKGYKMPHQLSGGEQQRVVIARAILNDPQVILADEPTGNLDPDTSLQIMEILINIKNSGCAVLMATHNYQLLKKYPERTIRCEKERLIDTEKPTEIDFSELQ